MRNLFYAIILILSLTACREIKVDKTKLLASDYRLFQDTPAWDLAKAVDDNNIRKIRNVIKNNPSLINYQEPMYGNTVLIQAVFQHDYISFVQLLELGADVNLHDRLDGESAIITACKYDCGSKYVKKLLEYGADPNDLEVGERHEYNRTRYTPLRGAAENGDIESVKLLIQAGADVNFCDEFGAYALKHATIHRHYKVALLLLENNADFTKIIFKGIDNQKDRYLVDLLRQEMVKLGSEEHKDKMKIVDFLYKQGIDYHTHPIPEYILERIKEEYPDTWQEYIEKY